ncbi:MAG: hypothetical protein GF417_03280 [Candidatus Latescibacteria bacterium]|nr:hypothetical protein [bacterium]MBD3423450.1 hypothetical protein [Candidatus Latescibacterota bacterium]
MRKLFYLFIAISLLASGCGGGGVDKTSMGEEGRDLPDWVLNPGQVGSDNDIIGVGVVSGVRNKALAIKTAENRAIGSIARVFRTRVEGMMEDYMASTLSGDMDSSEEQNIVNVQRTIIDQSISGIYVDKRYIDDDDNTVYARARLDFDTFRENLEKLNEIDMAMKEYVQKNAQDAFKRLDAQIDRGE